MSDDEICTVQEIILKRIRFNMKQSFGMFALESLNITREKSFEIFADQISLNFKMDILGQKNEQEYSVCIDVPVNFWQHFVKDYMPNFYKKKFPVKMKKIERIVKFEHIALLPKINISPEIHSDEVIMYSQPKYNI